LLFSCPPQRRRIPVTASPDSVSELMGIA